MITLFSNFKEIKEIIKIPSEDIVDILNKSVILEENILDVREKVMSNDIYRYSYIINQCNTKTVLRASLSSAKDKVFSNELEIVPYCSEYKLKGKSIVSRRTVFPFHVLCEVNPGPFPSTFSYNVKATPVLIKEEISEYRTELYVTFEINYLSYRKNYSYKIIGDDVEIKRGEFVFEGGANLRFREKFMFPFQINKCRIVVSWMADIFDTSDRKTDHKPDIGEIFEDVEPKFEDRGLLGTIYGTVKSVPEHHAELLDPIYSTPSKSRTLLNGEENRDAIFKMFSTGLELPAVHHDLSYLILYDVDCEKVSCSVKSGAEDNEYTSTVVSDSARHSKEKKR